MPRRATCGTGRRPALILPAMPTTATWPRSATPRPAVKADAGKGGDKQNMTADKSKPMYMLAPGKKLARTASGWRRMRWKSPTIRLKAGDVVTFRMPVAAEGSFADIKAVSRYADGAWTVILSRKLDTGHDDRCGFRPQKKYSFAMALFDDSKDQDSYDSEVLTWSSNTDPGSGTESMVEDNESPGTGLRCCVRGDRETAPGGGAGGCHLLAPVFRSDAAGADLPAVPVRGVDGFCLYTGSGHCL